MTQHVDVLGQSVPLQRLTRDAYFALMDARALPESGRVELIEGVLVPMSPSNSPHGRALFAVSAAIARGLPDGYEGASDVALGLEVETVVAPDITIVPINFDYQNVDGSEIVLAVEIADSSLAKDLDTKSLIYARNGVREVWVIDLNGKVIHVFRHPEADAYRSHVEFDWTERVTSEVLPTVSLKAVDVIGSASRD